MKTYEDEETSTNEPPDPGDSARKEGSNKGNILVLS
jgi:hypothetical protein